MNRTYPSTDPVQIQPTVKPNNSRPAQPAPIIPDPKPVIEVAVDPLPLPPDFLARLARCYAPAIERIRQRERDVAEGR